MKKSVKFQLYTDAFARMESVYILCYLDNGVMMTPKRRVFIVSFCLSRIQKVLNYVLNYVELNSIADKKQNNRKNLIDLKAFKILQ